MESRGRRWVEDHEHDVCEECNTTIVASYFSTNKKHCRKTYGGIRSKAPQGTSLKKDKNLQEKTFTHLISYHQKQKLLSSEIKEVFEISKAEIANIEKFYENSLQNHLVSNFEERLKRVSTNENKTNAALQKEIFTDLRAYLMDSYSVESNKMSKKNRKQLLKNCVEQLKTCY